MASTGDSFSWANSSEISTLSTSPIRILVLSGTVTPASWAILKADWPTILAFRAPLMMMVLRTLFSSDLERIWQPRFTNSAFTAS